MTRRSSLSSLILVAVMAVVGSLALVARTAPAATPTAAPSLQDSGITVEYLGWSHYRLTSPTGKVVILNPNITTNPDAATTVDETIARGVDMIVVADGHGDEQGQTIEIAQATGARVVPSSFELATWFAEKGVPRPQLAFVSPGEVDRYEGITVHVLNSIHGSRVSSPSDTVWYAGPAASFMVTFENGYTVYFSGSSQATMDMMAWADLYKPDAAIIHQTGYHEPRDSALMVKYMTNNNPNLKTVLPHHHRVRPQPGEYFRPSDLRTEIERLGINVNFIEPEPARPYTLTK